MNKTQQNVTFKIDSSMEKIYYYVPFTVPENTEVLQMDYVVNKKNKLDVALVGADGNQVGAAGQKVTHITVSERYASLGYYPITPMPGTWQILIGVSQCLRPETVTFVMTFTEKETRWLKGDTHIHTHHSDGLYTPKKVHRLAVKKGFDYAIFTDHNNNMRGHFEPFFHRNMLAINGQELTSFNGHVNLWGIKNPVDLPFGFNTLEEYRKIAAEARERGCTMSINHLTCKNCGWRFWQDDETDPAKKTLPTDLDFDSCEVWNGPMRIDNVTAVQWWHQQLLKGWRLPAVGGSDYHQNYVGVNLLGSPTTYIYAHSNTTEDVLEALKSGRSFITHSPTSTQMYLTVDGKMPGESTVWHSGCEGKLKLIKPKKGHRLLVYNNDTVVLDTKLPGKKEAEYTFALPEKGFVRAEIRYHYNIVIKTIYKRVVALLMPKDVGQPIPEFYWALTNPVWME